HQRTAARLLPQGRHPRQLFTGASHGGRGGTQQPSPHGPARPLSRRSIRRPASLTGSVGVATL
ncbi:putative histidine kinase hhk2p protein, partial [Mycolicibacterium fortuitum subsp. acetamidolyticum]